MFGVSEDSCRLSLEIFGEISCESRCNEKPTKTLGLWIDMKMRKLHLIHAADLPKKCDHRYYPCVLEDPDNTRFGVCIVDTGYLHSKRLEEFQGKNRLSHAH